MYICTSTSSMVDEMYFPLYMFTKFQKSVSKCDKKAIQGPWGFRYHKICLSFPSKGRQCRPHFITRNLVSGGINDVASLEAIELTGSANRVRPNGLETKPVAHLKLTWQLGGGVDTINRIARRAPNTSGVGGFGMRNIKRVVHG